jgi:gamma-glutamylputrescine oxidase
MMELSIWEKESFFAPQDIVIIGSGFCGLWSALKLKTAHPHKKITILESGLIPTGASTRNAGFSCFGSPSELLHDMDTMGTAKTLELVKMRYDGLLEIRQHFDDASIGYDPSGGYECFKNTDPDWQLCNDKLDWLNEKLQPVTGINFYPGRREAGELWI